MGFLKKFGDKIFGSSKPAQPSAAKQPVASSQPAPGTPNDLKKIEEVYQREREKMHGAIADKFKDDLSPAEIRLVQTFGNLTQREREFLLGNAMSVVSTNVEFVQYDWDANSLYIGFKNGGLYQYWQITPQEARSLFSAGSKGKWVWDHLRRRGTVYGHKKPYAYLGTSAPRVQMPGKRYEPKWHRKAKWRREHGSIPPSGKVPKNWSKWGPIGRAGGE